jgi:hypothetical protein
MAAQAPEPQVMSQQFKSGQVKEVRVLMSVLA